MYEKVVLFWSGGKDCTLALQKIRSDFPPERITLLSTVNKTNARVSMHGVRSELIEDQVRALGTEIEFLELPESISMEEYRTAVRNKLQTLAKKEYTHVAFGDIFLEDLRKYRMSLLEGTSLKPLFPIWGWNTLRMAEKFVTDDFKAIIVCADKAKLDSSFIGREFNKKLLHDLPQSVDPCGENGEFHTFVYDGPLFLAPVQFSTGKSVTKSYPLSSEEDIEMSFQFLDVTPS